LFQSTVKADAIVAADCSPAIRTFPSLSVLLKKSSDSVLLDELEVLDHTHPEVSPVASVNVKQRVAWEVLAFVTVLDPVISQQIASLLEECTLLVPWPATGAVRHSDSLAFDIMFESKVSAAYRAVHAARSYQLRTD
jgi:hypothetical protein